jgi:16S rRNA (guanine527-N7)-methyltransferase
LSVAFAELEPELVAGCRELGIVLSAAQARAQLALLAELREWNTRFNLTSITAPADMLRKHLLDSLAVLPHLRGTRIADVGTGAGFPGMPLAICSPERQFTLIDGTAKKCRFVEHAAQMLEIRNVTVVHARAESWRPAAAFDTVVARALASLAEFIRHAAHLCAPGGRMLAMKGRVPEAELASLPRGWRLVALHRLVVPGLDAERHLVELARGVDAQRGRS